MIRDGGLWFQLPLHFTTLVVGSSGSTTKEKHALLYPAWKGYEAVQSGLQSLGFTVRVSASRPEVMEYCGNSGVGLLIVKVESGDNDLAAEIIKVSDSRSFQVPVVFLTDSGDSPGEQRVDVLTLAQEVSARRLVISAGALYFKKRLLESGALRERTGRAVDDLWMDIIGRMMGSTQ